MVVKLLIITHLFNLTNPKIMTTSNKSEQVILELKMVIKEYMDYCNEKNTPYVCKLKQTKEGYKAIEDFIINMVIQTDKSVSEAIVEKERILNPNYLTD